MNEQHADLDGQKRALRKRMLTVRRALSVDERAEDRAEPDPFEMPEAKKDEGQDDAETAAADVISGLYAADILPEMLRYLFDKQFVGFGGDIGMKEEGYPDRTDQNARNIIDRPDREAFERQFR